MTASIAWLRSACLAGSRAT